MAPDANTATREAMVVAALHPPRAYGEPVVKGKLRVEPEDFRVDEELGFSAAGTGQHLLLRVRKRNANTPWVARELARVCRCRPQDVGYAGLKDRRAVTTQWFSVPQSTLEASGWLTIKTAEFEVLEAYQHSRKLPRGALAGNRFEIRVRDAEWDDAQLSERVGQVIRRGVPNYFGPQRFGRDGANLIRLGAGLRSLRPAEKGFVLSAARSVVFNAVLAERVEQGSWESVSNGDIAILDGRGSIFSVDGTDDTVTDRCERLQIHPTGPLWGRGEPKSVGSVLERETRVAAQFPDACALVIAAGMDHERRSLRLAVRDFTWAREAAGAVVFRFGLTRGSFATTVLREILDVAPLEEAESEG